MAGCKNQLIMNYCGKFLVSSFCQRSSLLTLKDLPLYTFWVRFPIEKYK